VWGGELLGGPRTTKRNDYDNSLYRERNISIWSERVRGGQGGGIESGRISVYGTKSLERGGNEYTRMTEGDLT